MELARNRRRPVDEIIRQDLDPYISSSTTQDRELREMRMLLEGEPGSLMKPSGARSMGMRLRLR
jgi:hypothetical protein